MNKQLLQRRAVGVTPAKPVLRKQRRLALAAERHARRRKISTTSGPSRSERSARAAALPLNRGASLIVVLVLSLGLWAATCGTVASLGRCADMRPHYSRALGFAHWAARLLNPPAYTAVLKMLCRRSRHGDERCSMRQAWHVRRHASSRPTNNRFHAGHSIFLTD